MATLEISARGDGQVIGRQQGTVGHCNDTLHGTTGDDFFKRRLERHHLNGIAVKDFMVEGRPSAVCAAPSITWRAISPYSDMPN